MKKKNRIVYTFRGKIERAPRRGAISFVWHEGYSATSDGGKVCYPWMTKAECRENARLQGAIAVFENPVADLVHGKITPEEFANGRPQPRAEAFTPSPVQEFIAKDTCGWSDMYARYTHVPSGKTHVVLDSTVLSDRSLLAFLVSFPADVPVHYCPTRYTTEGTRKLGNVGEIAAKVKARIDEATAWRQPH